MLAGDSLYFPFFVQDSEQRTAVHICILKKMPEEFLASMDCWIVGVVLYSNIVRSCAGVGLKQICQLFSQGSCQCFRAAVVCPSC